MGGRRNSIVTWAALAERLPRDPTPPPDLHRLPSFSATRHLSPSGVAPLDPLSLAHLAGAAVFHFPSYLTLSSIIDSFNKKKKKPLES